MNTGTNGHAHRKKGDKLTGLSPFEIEETWNRIQNPQNLDDALLAVKADEQYKEFERAYRRAFKRGLSTMEEK